MNRTTLESESIRQAAYILRDRQSVVTSADGWQLLKDAETYLWQRYAEARLWECGYQRQANNIYALPGSLWTATGAGQLVPKSHDEDIYVLDGRLFVIRHVFRGVPYKGGRHEQEVVSEFHTVEEMMEWFETNGKRSEPGLPAFANSWD